MRIGVQISRRKKPGIAVAREKETGYGREIYEEKFNCSRQAFVQNVQDEIICAFPEQSDESNCQSRVPFC